jgi:hypothetical protein
VLKAHVEQALLPEGFYLRAQRDFVGKLRAWRVHGSMVARPTAEIQRELPYLQGGFEKQKSKEKNADRHQDAFMVPLTSKQTHALSAFSMVGTENWYSEARLGLMYERDDTHRWHPLLLPGSNVYLHP